MTVTDKLANIEKLAASGPQLSGSERAEYDQICTRLRRAEGDLRRATQRRDEMKIAKAARAITRAKQFRESFLEPRVGHLWAPPRIVAKFKQLWSGPGTSGFHVHECEMVLDHKDLSGPSYRTVRVLKDEGGPPTNARSAPDMMGVAWFAITDQIRSGQIVVIDEGARS